MSHCEKSEKMIITYWRTRLTQDTDVSKQDFKVFGTVWVKASLLWHLLGLAAVLETHRITLLDLLRELLRQVINVVMSLHLVTLWTGGRFAGWGLGYGGQRRVAFILGTFIASLEKSVTVNNFDW